MDDAFNYVDDYLSVEISKIKDLHRINNLAVSLSSMSHEEKQQLYAVCKELENHGCQIPIVWAIQDFNSELDYGGSAYYIFIKSIIDIYKKPTDILDDISEGNQKYQGLLEIAKEFLKEEYQDFFIAFSFQLSLKIIALIDDGNQKSKALRTWQLFGSSSFNSNKSEILRLKDFRENNEFDF